MNVAHLFERTARRDPEAPAVALGRSVLLDHGALALRAARLAGALRDRLRLGAGDRVALIAANRAEYLEALLGTWWAGLAAVPINAKLHPQELAFVLGDAGARLCLVSPELAPAVGALAGGLPELDRVIELGSAEYRRLLEADPRSLEPTDGNAMAWLFYTSGTTGRPKGAMITHRNLRAMTYGYLIDVDEVGPREAILHAAPMSHGSGLYIVPHAAVGSCQVVPESGGFDAAEVLDLIGAHRGVHMFAAPTMVQRLVAPRPRAGAGSPQPRDDHLWRGAHVPGRPRGGARGVRAIGWPSSTARARAPCASRRCPGASTGRRPWRAGGTGCSPWARSSSSPSSGSAMPTAGRCRWARQAR